jgi:hypothetical protein
VRALRFVGIFVGAIAVLMLSHTISINVSNKPTFPANPRRHDAIGLIAVAEPKPSPCPKAVYVINDTPNIQNALMRLKLLDLLPTKFGREEPTHFCAGRKDVCAGKDGGFVNLEFSALGVGIDLRVNDPANALCGQIARIRNPDAGDGKHMEVFDPEPVYRDIGAFNNRQGTFGDTSSPLGNLYRLIHVAGVAAQLNSLPNADSGNGYGDEHKPFRECSQLCRINRKLARILGEPPFVSAALFLIVAGALGHRGFSLYYRGRRFAGLVLVLGGVALALSDGFATIGEGPLGWIVWVGG